MGKGDKKTKRGKIILGTYGKLRPKRGKFKIRPKTIKGPQAK
ncbi:30S ribosomal protein THX [Ulvibacter antarcticus]|uniref:SSU ribosomal protein S31P n=1 Tax=Ulvibacter antarcticus TaxID=442714 RepID=A0A3L9Y7V9_9FLAO|nr:30S ribosomal protein THX [Ulvibacter antarcticus]RMA56801.1 SSU ribosomal protein S31P [Ulvibacter antarcticus]